MAKISDKGNKNQYLDYKLCQLYLNSYFKMRPSPFAGKIKKKQIKVEKHQQKRQQPIDEVPNITEDNHLKPPSNRNMIKLSKQKSQEKQKNPKRIYDALKQEDEGEKQIKASASFKPNLKLKPGTLGKKIKLPTSQNVNEPKNEEEQQKPQQQLRPVLKPNLLRKNENIIHQKKQNREQVIIGEEQKSRNEEESFDGSGSPSQSMSMAPKFKIKSKHEPEFPIIHQQPMEQTGFGINNFADLKIETRQINFNLSQTKASSAKIQRQQARTKALQNLLNLEIDLFEQTLNISCVTPYEIYINKIKGGSLKNSNDQAFDQKSNATCQTATLEFQDFTNQCPQDYNTDINSIVQSDEAQAFARFITKVSPVMQQLIKPSNTIVMPPIFLLALRPQFKKMMACPFPLFVYHSQSLGVGIIVIGQKLYIADGQIESVLSLNNIMVAGSKNGVIYLWAGKNDRNSRLYRKVLQCTQSTNFQLPEYTTQQLDRFSVYRSEYPIVSLMQQSNDQFISLDSCCKMIKWKIQRNSNDKIDLKTESSYQFMNMIQRPNLIGYCLRKRNENYFICSSAGILVWNGEQIIQRLDTEGFQVKCLALPHRTHFVYSACEDNSIRIFGQHYANQLYKFFVPDSQSVVDIFVPETQYDNKKISLAAKVFVITASGNIYYLNLLTSSAEAKLITNKQDKKERDIIYKGVNKLSKGFELVTLWRDLKCTSEIKKIDVDLQATVENIKGILQQNRQLHSWLQSSYALTVIQ